MTVPPVVGLIINPVAGIGGPVALAGSDGEQIQRLARQRGGIPRAAEQAVRALHALRKARGTASDLTLLAAPGPMGAATAAGAGFPYRTVPLELGSPTSAADTTNCVSAMARAGVDLVLFAGGDGTAADIAAGVGTSIPVLGIPAGVKMYSGGFAVTPEAAGIIAAQFLSSSTRRVTTAEILDLDEDELRAGRVCPVLTSAVTVPTAPAIQHRKTPTAAALNGQVAAVASAAAAILRTGPPVAVGPGGTTAAVLDRMGLSATLLGVDVVRDGRLTHPNITEPDLYRLATAGPLRIMLTVIGGQGFILGRGNQQFSPRVLRAVGLDGLVVIAPEGKLTALGGRPLLADTGDPATDAWLAGYRRVLTGEGTWAAYRIAPPPSPQTALRSPT